MDDYKKKVRARHRTMTFKERFLDYNENPVLFLLFSWRFHYYNKVFKGWMELIFTGKVK